jgi:hypothetical protein
MHLYKMIISKDNAWEVMNELGQLDILHFHNLNVEE